MNEERTEMRLRQNGTYPWLLWHTCSVMVNQMMVATVNLSKWWIHINH